MEKELSKRHYAVSEDKKLEIMRVHFGESKGIQETATELGLSRGQVSGFVFKVKTENNLSSKGMKRDDAQKILKDFYYDVYLKGAVAKPAAKTVKKASVKPVKKSAKKPKSGFTRDEEKDVIQ